MRVFARLFVIVLVAGALYSFSGPVFSPFSENNGAFIQQDFLCGMFDADGGYYITDEGSISIINNGGNYIVMCQASGVPNSTGQAKQYRNFYCSTFVGEGVWTTDTQENISASGNAMLQCKIKI